MGRKKFWIFLICGLLGLAIGLYFGGYVHYKEIEHRADINYSGADSFFTGGLISTGILLLQTISAASIAVGILNITIETDHWRGYFEERLRGVVTHSNYLQTLSVDELGKIRNEVLKSHFRDNEIDREGGFLKFFDKHLYKFIGTPYRESLHVIIDVGPSRDQEHWQDQVRYTCRRVCGSIQSSVRWMSDYEGEMCSLNIDVIYPGGSGNEGMRKTIASLDNEQIAKHKAEHFSNSDKDVLSTSNYDFNYSLDEYKNDDGLIVERDAVYHIDKEQFQSWVVLVPTRKFDFQIRFPSDAAIQSEVMILDSALISKKQGNGWLSIASDAWLLPESGLVWRVFDGNRFDAAVPSKDMKEA